MATRQTTFTDSSTLTAAQLNNEFNEIFTNLTNANVASGAAIAISKTELATFVPWTAWTPTITVSGGTSPTYTSRFVARYMRIGKLVIAMIDFANSSGGTPGAGSAILAVSWPGGLVSSPTSGTIGNGGYFNSSSGGGLTAFYNSGSTFGFLKHGTASNLAGDDQNNVIRAIRAILMYEVA